MSKEYNEGRVAHASGYAIGRCPYKYNTLQYDDWTRGFRSYNGR